MLLEMDWTGKEEFGKAPFEEWTVDGKAAGRVRSSGLLTFTTIYEAGHMVSRLSSASTNGRLLTYLIGCG